MANDIDALFKLPPAEFTAARNALMSRLKKAGKPDEADRIKGLSRPSLSAWAVNQLYWRHRKAFDRLIAAGEQFKKAQSAQLAGKAGNLRGPLDARREALAELSRLAMGLLEGAGHSATPDTMRRVNTTLEALATYGVDPGAPPAGRLTDDIAPPGFEALAALVPRDGGRRRGDEPTKVIPFRQAATPRRGGRTPKGAAPDERRTRAEARKAALAAAQTAVRAAERELRDARKTAAQAEAALKSAAARAKEAEKRKAALEARFETVTALADRTRQEARGVAARAEEAAQAVEDAERALEKARQALTGLSQT